ncbi:retroviral-like aspartic protease [Candidatus Woesearchaeota archaeon]|nr:retroviral-like aspartic protease [Candidatus Woesearchaeota archaeon]
MTISFRYKGVKRPDGSLVKTPSIPITLAGKETFETIGLLDSGADISAMPKSIAEILGLSLEGEVKFAYGIGGKVKSTESKVKIIIRKGHERYDFYIPIKVILDDYDFPILLGRVGIFDKFVVTFDQENERILLKRKTER